MKHLACIAILGLAATPAFAQDVSIGGGLTILGPTIEGTYDLSGQVDLRGQLVGGVSLSDTDTVDIDGRDYTIDGTISFGGLALVGDYYPTASGWRLSGGLFVSNTSLSANFDGPETFDADIAFKNEVAAMLTTGYRHGFGENWYVAGDIGAIFSELEASTDNTDPAVLDEVDQLNEDLSDLPVVPYLSITLGYRW